MSQISSVTFLPFAFLSALRRGILPADIWREFRRMGIRLKPRLIFWLKLLRQAKLIGHGSIPRPSRYLHRWLALSADAQTQHLLEAWLKAPKNRKDRLARRAMLLRLTQGKPLIKRDQRDLNGLKALGICDGEKLSAWGQLLLNKKGEMPSPLPQRPWYIKENRLIVPLPTDWTLLWTLESWLEPLAPGIYALDRKAIRSALQLATAQEMIALLEEGLPPLPYRASPPKGGRTSPCPLWGKARMGEQIFQPPALPTGRACAVKRSKTCRETTQTTRHRPQTALERSARKRPQDPHSGQANPPI